MPRFHAQEDRAARFKAPLLKAYTAFGLPELLAVKAAVGDGPTEILLYDEIGEWGVSATAFALALAKAGNGPLTVRINSPGGNAMDGLAIYNSLKAHSSPVTVVVDGMAASAASIVAMGGTSIIMNKASMMMIHNAGGLCIGKKVDMRAFADVLDKIDGVMAAIYTAQIQKRGARADDVAALMDAETYFTADEAKAGGLVDAIVDPVPIPNSKALSIFSKADIRAAIEPYDPDGDGDNDAQEALTLIQAAMAMLNGAAAALTGEDGTSDTEAEETGQGNDDGTVIVPTSKLPTVITAEATTSEWVVGADETLPIDDKTSWDGPAAEERMLDAAGFNGDSPDPAKAKRGFLVWDHHNPKLKGSYKLPFADMVGTDLRAIKGGIDAAASRLPQTDIPPAVRASAKKVLDGYEKRAKPEAPKPDSKLAQRLFRLRIAEVED